MRTLKSKLRPPSPELRGALGSIKFPAFAELKMDGEFNFVHINNQKAFCVNKYGTVKTEFKALNVLMKEVSIKASSVTMLAEVYFGDGKAGRLYDLLSNKKSDDLGLYVFDVLEIDGKDLRNTPLIDRKEYLHDLLSGKEASCKVIHTKEEAMGYFTQVTKAEDCYEGVVLKPFESKLVLGPCDWVKLKWKDQNDYEVLFIDPTLERIEIKAPIANKPGEFIAVGVKAPNKYKKYIKVGDRVTVEHQGILESSSLRHPVLLARKEWR